MKLWAQHRWRIATAVVALAVVVVGKQLYRDASAAELRVFLAPTARLVGWLTSGHFMYEAGPGWIDRDLGFVIAPACAGVNFALAAFLALSIGGLAAIPVTTARAALGRLAAAAAIAYAATIVVNTARIAIAIELHRPDLHELEGIVVYLAGLCALYAIARSFDRRQHVAAR